jgi:hypothetical protein
MPIPYYDSADGRRLDELSDAKAQRYLAEGKAHPIRSKNGRIVRLYSLPRERTPATIAAAVAQLHAGASQTTQRIRNDERVLIAPPNMREHRHILNERLRYE